MRHPKLKRRRFRVWYVTLPIAIFATLVFFDFLAENWYMMESEDNPFGVIGMLMVYATYMGIWMIIGIIAWIVTIVVMVKHR